MNIGLMNTNGNFISTVNTIVFPGESIDGTDKIKLKQAKAKPATIIPRSTINILIVNSADKKIAPKIRGNEEKMSPYINVLQTLPNRIVLIEIGHVINLSNVFLIVSHGNTMGPIEVDDKNIIIAINPEIIYIGSTLLPTVKAINKITGKIIP